MKLVRVSSLEESSRDLDHRLGPKGRGSTRGDELLLECDIWPCSVAQNNPSKLKYFVNTTFYADRLSVRTPQRGTLVSTQLVLL